MANSLTLNLSETPGGPTIIHVLFPDAGSNEIRVEAIRPAGGEIAFDFTNPPDRSLATLVYLSEAFGLVATAAELLVQGMSLKLIAATLAAIGTTVKII